MNILCGLGFHTIKFDCQNHGDFVICAGACTRCGTAFLESAEMNHNA